MAKKAALSHHDIIKDIKAGKFAPLYFLMGDEPYFIDQITDAIIEHALTNDERDFNETILYGNETNIEIIINTARMYPSFSNRRLVVVKEAKALKNIELIDSYCKNIQTSTILVIAYKYAKLDRRTAAAKSIDKEGVLYEATKMYDNQLPAWINTMVTEKGYRIDAKAAALLAEFVGNDLPRIDSEVEKLIITLPAETRQINSDLIERNTGISKEYNTFEFVNAISNKNIAKANQIASYFEKSKDMTLARILPTIHTHFIRLFQAHYLPRNCKTDDGFKQYLGLNYFQLQDMKAAINNYSGSKVLQIIREIRSTEARYKGVGNYSTTEGELLKELLFKILH